jgi:hypothetical protein
MSFPPVTLWSTAEYSCDLRRKDGSKFDVVLRHDGHTIRLNTCDSEQKARELAYQWKVALVPSER